VLTARQVAAAGVPKALGQMSRPSPDIRICPAHTGIRKVGPRYATAVRIERVKPPGRPAFMPWLFMLSGDVQGLFKERTSRPRCTSPPPPCATISPRPSARPRPATAWRPSAPPVRTAGC